MSTKKNVLKSFVLIGACMMFSGSVGLSRRADGARYLSHPPLRRVQPASSRPMDKGPAFFVDAVGGDDKNDGSKGTPWKTINHALTRIDAGATLYLRGGTYFENVYCAVKGKEDAPITIRSHPGELAIIDGGIPEFQTAPKNAWKPFRGGGPGEYVSTSTFRNIRDVIGLFGDSNVGLQTYWYAMDLGATNEMIIKDEKIMVKAYYCGPGLWYDKDNGKIHVRLAHTNITLPKEAGHTVVNYKGETDPRKLPLVIAPFNSVALYVDQAMHARFQDLLIRGGGYRTVKLIFGVDLTFENCTIYCGTYGIWSKNTGPFVMTNCAVYGTMAPWNFRSDTALRSYDGRVYPPFVGGDMVKPERAGADKALAARPVRHITRLTTHAVLVTEGGHEFQVFYHPMNHDWEISNCEFTDGHDGVYLSGRNIRFHHNWIANMNDDGIYLSSPTPYVTDKLYVYQNLISTVVAPFGTHGRGGPGGDIYVYRNIVDQRGPILYVRPSPEHPGGYIANGTNTLLTHGSTLHMERMYFYQNTILQGVFHSTGPFAGAMTAAQPGAARRVFNNLYAYYPTNYFGRAPVEGYPLFRLVGKDLDLQADGNLHWHVIKGKDAPADFLETVRTHPLAEAARKAYPAGWAANSVVGDPKFVRFDRSRTADNDYRLGEGSAAIGQGVALPKEWEDPLRPKKDGARPDIGALPHGAGPLRVGINRRIVAGTVEGLGHFPRP